MKHLSLKDVMQNLSVTINADGYEISNPAGSAQYDAWGVRTTVNGIPEYFPASISVTGMRKPEVVVPVKINGDKPLRQLIIGLSVKTDTIDLDKLEAQLERIAALRHQEASIDWQVARHIRDAAEKAITKALLQGGPVNAAMRR